jgi:hypothetical protein
MTFSSQLKHAERHGAARAVETEDVARGGPGLRITSRESSAEDVDGKHGSWWCDPCDRMRPIEMAGIEPVCAICRTPCVPSVGR